MKRTCKKHGLTDYILESRGCYRCKQCRNDNVNAWRRRIKSELVRYKGGQCEVCFYDKCISCLEFHHRDPSGKDFQISGTNKNINDLKKEVDKCSLLCRNCHGEIHAGLVCIPR